MDWWINFQNPSMALVRLKWGCAVLGKRRPGYGSATACWYKGSLSLEDVDIYIPPNLKLQIAIPGQGKGSRAALVGISREQEGGRRSIMGLPFSLFFSIIQSTSEQA